MLLTTDNGGFGNANNLKVRVKMYLSEHGDELMPTVQYDGITLIRQNLKIKCESNDPSWVQAQGESNDLEGYFCVLNFIGEHGRV